MTRAWWLRAQASRFSSLISSLISSFSWVASNGRDGATSHPKKICIRGNMRARGSFFRCRRFNASFKQPQESTDVGADPTSHQLSLSGKCCKEKPPDFKTQAGNKIEGRSARQRKRQRKVARKGSGVRISSPPRLKSLQSLTITNRRSANSAPNVRSAQAFGGQAGRQSISAAYRQTPCKRGHEIGHFL